VNRIRIPDRRSWPTAPRPQQPAEHARDQHPEYRRGDGAEKGVQRREGRNSHRTPLIATASIIIADARILGARRISTGGISTGGIFAGTSAIGFQQQRLNFLPLPQLH